MTQTAKLFTSGRSQAVRLPSEFRFEGNEVFIRRDPLTGDVILSRKPADWAEVAQHYNYALELLTDPNDAALKQLPDLAATQKRLLALATDAQLLYGKPASVVGRFPFTSKNVEKLRCARAVFTSLATNQYAGTTRSTQRSFVSLEWQL